MQFSKYFVFFVAIVLTACQKEEHAIPTSQSPLVETNLINADFLVLNPEKGLVFYKEKPFTGASLSFYEEGLKAISIDYFNGKKHGLYKKWFANGQISFESTYSNGKKHGLTQSWWSNGNLRSISRYKNGVPHGTQEQWYKSGTLFKKIQLAYGKEEGMQQSWRENGKIYNNYEAKNGRIFGLKRANLCYELEDEVIQYKDN